MTLFEKFKGISDTTIDLTKEKFNGVKASITSTINNTPTLTIIRPDQTDEALSKMMETLDWGYNHVIQDSIPVLGTVEKMVNDFISKNKTKTEACESMIRWQLTYAGGAGFVTNIGGWITMPITLPANVASVLYIQMRLICGIALLGGYDLKSEQVKTFVYITLLGSGANVALDKFAVAFTGKLINNTIKNKISRETLTSINRFVGFRLLTKFGSTGLINLKNIVPIVGGFVGGAIDVLATNTIANTAKKLFLGDILSQEKSMELEKIRIQLLITMAKIDGSTESSEKKLIEQIITSSDLLDETKIFLIEALNNNELNEVDVSLFIGNELFSYSLLFQNPFRSI